MPWSGLTCPPLGTASWGLLGPSKWGLGSVPFPKAYFVHNWLGALPSCHPSSLLRMAAGGAVPLLGLVLGFPKARSAAWPSSAFSGLCNGHSHFLLPPSGWAKHPPSRGALTFAWDNRVAFTIFQVVVTQAGRLGGAGSHTVQVFKVSPPTMPATHTHSTTPAQASPAHRVTILTSWHRSLHCPPPELPTSGVHLPPHGAQARPLGVFPLPHPNPTPTSPSAVMLSLYILHLMPPEPLDGLANFTRLAALPLPWALGPGPHSNREDSSSPSLIPCSRAAPPVAGCPSPRAATLPAPPFAFRPARAFLDCPVCFSCQDPDLRC